jgi:hypothetical protein
MLNLEPLITRLVDDVLRAIRGAALAELREILASSEHDLERKPRPLDPSRVFHPPAKGFPVARATRSATPVARAESRTHPEPEPHSEITDPERLLAHPKAPPPPAVPPAEEVEPPLAQSAPVESEAEPPTPAAPAAAAVEHSAGNAPTRLRVGESLANTTGTGMVIRRAKRT